MSPGSPDTPKAESGYRVQFANARIYVYIYTYTYTYSFYYYYYYYTYLLPLRPLCCCGHCKLGFGAAGEKGVGTRSQVNSLSSSSSRMFGLPGELVSECSVPCHQCLLSPPLHHPAGTLRSPCHPYSSLRGQYKADRSRSYQLEYLLILATHPPSQLYPVNAAHTTNTNMLHLGNI